MARHIVAKFGGKGLTELFVAMPPFEMIEYLIVRLMRCSHGTTPRGGDLRRQEKRRKMFFIDVSKAHLYAPTEEDSSAYVELPAECRKPGVCVVTSISGSTACGPRVAAGRRNMAGGLWT